MQVKTLLEWHKMHLIDTNVPRFVSLCLLETTAMQPYKKTPNRSRRRLAWVWTRVDTRNHVSDEGQDPPRERELWGKYFGMSRRSESTYVTYIHRYSHGDVSTCSLAVDINSSFESSDAVSGYQYCSNLSTHAHTYM